MESNNVLKMSDCDFDCSWEDRIRITKDDVPIIDVELSELTTIMLKEDVVQLHLFGVTYLEITHEDAKGMLESHAENWVEKEN
jgi:hypothetical protein